MTQSSPMSTACQSDICSGRPISERLPIEQPNRRNMGFAKAVPETAPIKPAISLKKLSCARKYVKCRIDQNGALFARPHRLPTSINLILSASSGSRRGTIRLVNKAASVLPKPALLSATRKNVARKIVNPGMRPTEARSFRKNLAKKMRREGLALMAGSC